MKRHAIAVCLWLLAASQPARAQLTLSEYPSATNKTGCSLVNTGGAVVISVSPRPQARLLVDLSSSAGRTISVIFDGSPDSPLAREIRLPSRPGEAWTISAAGERSAVATPDGKGSVLMAYVAEADCTAVALTAKLHMLVVGLDGATWSEVKETPSLSIQVKADALKLEDTSAADASMGANSLVRSTRGLDSAIPDALRETLSLLAEIAVDRAKAEGARLLRSRIKRYLCDELTLDKVFGKVDHGNQRLLPTTCGQLENLRLSDLGASATGFVDALRADTMDVVVPALIAYLPSQLPPAARVASSTAAVVYRIASTAVRRGFTPEAVRIAALGLLDIADVPDELKHVLRVALQCTKQECTLGDVQAFVAQLKAKEAKLGDPFWLDAALRLLTILQPRANADGAKLGGELVDLLLDVVRRECAKDRKCEIVVAAFRDIAVGVIEADYLRALGGLQAAFVASGVGAKLKGKPLELAASIASYISTYRETKDKDAATARELRKKALEGLIDAGTNRTNREDDVIVSIGASVGFTRGRRYLDTAPSSEIAENQRLQDLRLPLGLTLQQMPPKSRWLGASWYGMFAIADLAQFVSSPVKATLMDPADGSTVTTTVEPETKWSDFVAVELQLGARFGNERLPITIGFDLYYRPRMSFEIAGETKTTSVVHAGIFAGFNVPFFDLN